jgi:hypothetical protein
MVKLQARELREFFNSEQNFDFSDGAIQHISACVSSDVGESLRQWETIDERHLLGTPGIQ